MHANKQSVRPQWGTQRGEGEKGGGESWWFFFRFFAQPSESATSRARVEFRVPLLPSWKGIWSETRRLGVALMATDTEGKIRTPPLTDAVT